MNSPLPIMPPLRSGHIPSVTNPGEACAWCWPLLHPGPPYPEHWSSIICAGHDAWFDVQRVACRVRIAQENEVTHAS